MNTPRKLRQVVGPTGSLIYPGAALLNRTTVNASTLMRWRQHGLVTGRGDNTDPSWKLTRFGAEMLGWKEPRPSRWERFKGLLGLD